MTALTSISAAGLVDFPYAERGYTSGAGRPSLRMSRSAVPLRSSGTNERKVMHLEHIGIVVDDLAAATEFFTALGLEVEGEASVEGDPVDRINGLEGVQADVVILRAPDGNGSKLELAKSHSPAYEGDAPPLPANA